jgi:hypothetical protein
MIDTLRAQMDARGWAWLRYLLPAIASGAASWLAFMIIGQTPLIRASGLALVITGMTLTLRWMGALLSLVGGLALAFSPAFWSQTGGGASAGPASIVIAVIAAAVAAGLLIALLRRPYLAIGFALAVFALIFWSQVSTPRSLRLTGLLSAYLMFLLVDALRATHPRPDDPPPAPIDLQHAIGLLILLLLGVLNDPLFVLLLPATLMGLWLTRTPLPVWYWGALTAALIVGLRGIALTYIDPEWWRYSAVAAQDAGLEVPALLADGWWQGERWINLIRLITAQFTVIGVGLSILGLARLARWYPVLGVVTMIAYACYAAFGLLYFGPDRSILLTPLFIIQIVWLTYAVRAFGQWLNKTFHIVDYHPHWIATATYLTLPAYLFSLITL